ncbi:hypothetical protein MTO96_007093 [Rhipicephalus appendiculatus]
MAQEVPSSSVCDYTLLDLPLSPNWTYEDTSYDFLINKGTDHQLLFSVDLNWADTSISTRALLSRQFRHSLDVARSMLRRQRIHGLGIIKDLPSLITWDQRKPLLEVIYNNFNFVMTTIGVDRDDTKNFFAFQPDDTFTPSKYHDYLSLLNSIHGLSIVIILTITDENILEVVPSSSWNRSCLPQLSQPTMEDAVSAILSIPDPKVNYTLTVSLRLDEFSSFSIVSLFSHTSYLKRYPIQSHKSFFFELTCRREIYGRDPQGTTIYYVASPNCAFSSGGTVSDTMVTLETPRTVRHKVDETDLPNDSILEDRHPRRRLDRVQRDAQSGPKRVRRRS